MPKKINFTKAALEGLLDLHDGERITVSDLKQPGLIAELRPGGSLSFYFYKWGNGKPHKVKIGGFPEWTVDAARKETQRKIVVVAAGGDPSAERREKRAEWTLGDLWEHYLEHHAKPHKRSWREDEAQWKRYLTGWRKRQLSEIKKSDVQGLHNRLGKDSGPYAANRLRSLLHSMFNVAADAGWNGANPVRGVKKFPEHKRERFLRADELPKFFKALEDETSATVRDFVKVALLTGARKGNVQAMRWDQLVLDRAEWVIPLTKAGESQTVHLPAAAVEILRERQDGSKKDPWVFPGKGASGHLVDPTRIWKEILARAGLPGLRIHDLRRTLGSWQAATGASLPIIGKSLGHRNASTTQIYARLDLDPIRASVDTAALAILAAAKGGDNGK